MSSLAELLTPDAVRADVVAASKKALFQQLAGIAAPLSGFDPALIVDRLQQREKLGTTAFGGGVAIPHGKIEGLAQVKGVFVRLAHPLDLNAVDDLPVDLVFMLLSPPDRGAEHLKALASVSRLLRDRTFTAKLRGAASADALYALLTGVEARDAA